MSKKFAYLAIFVVGGFYYSITSNDLGRDAGGRIVNLTSLGGWIYTSARWGSSRRLAILVKCRII